MQTRSSPASAAEPLQTRHVVAASGVDRETLRFYERKGLLPGIRRTPSGYRGYPPDTPQRLKFIRLAQAGGFTLREIRVMLSASTALDVPSATLRQMGQRKMEELETRMKDLRRVHRTLARVVRDLDVPCPPGQCRVMQAFSTTR